MDQESAEEQILELLRGEDAKEFTVRIECKADRFYVSLSGPTVADPTGARPPAQGEGDTFWEAWHDVKPYWAD